MRGISTTFLLILGFGSTPLMGAIQQVRSPVYQAPGNNKPMTAAPGPVNPGGVNTMPTNNLQNARMNVNVNGALSSGGGLSNEGIGTTQQIQHAQAREGNVGGVGGVGVAGDNAMGALDSSQRYMVYYYPPSQSPDQYRASVVPVNPAQQSLSEPSMLSNIPWQDIGLVLASAVLVVGGGVLVYKGFADEVKARAMRGLEQIGWEEGSVMARRVLMAIDKFQKMNVETQ